MILSGALLSSTDAGESTEANNEDEEAPAENGEAYPLVETPVVDDAYDEDFEKDESAADEDANEDAPPDDENGGDKEEEEAADDVDKGEDEDLASEGKMRLFQSHRSSIT